MIVPCILHVKNVEVVMADNIEKIFSLEQILEIVDLEQQDSLDKLQKKFSKEQFEIDYAQLEA